MKDANFSKPTGMNSLGHKFALVVFLAIVAAGLSVAYTVNLLQEAAILQQQQVALTQNAKLYAAQLDSEFRHRERKAIAANQIISQALNQSRLQAVKRLTTAADGSIRSQDDYSAAFVHADNYTSRTAALFEETGQLWRHLSPLLLEDFFGFYFISKEHFIRIAPGNWALEVSANHNFDKDLFFSIATPEMNPDRQPRWTPVFYDDIWKKWMTSLIIPVYRNDEFIGVTGADLVLDDILAMLPAQAKNDYQQHTFLFDSSGMVLGSRLHQIPGSPAMNTRFTGLQLKQKTLHRYAETFSAAPAQYRTAAEQVPEKLIASEPIPSINWYLAAYSDKADVLASQQSFRTRLIIIFVIVAVVVALLLQFVSYQFMLKRLNRLSMAIFRLSRGDLQQVELDNKTDEIGLLNQAFGRMSEEILQLVSGLNAKIEEKERAERATRKLSKAVSFSSSGIVLTDQYLRIEYINPFLTEMIGCTDEQLQQQQLGMLFAEEMHHVGSEIAHTLAERQHWRGDMLLAFGGRQLWVSLAIAPIRDEKAALRIMFVRCRIFRLLSKARKKWSSWLTMTC